MEVDSLLKWIEDYQTGIENIDREHKQIIEEFEHLYQIMQLGKGHELYESLLNFLKEYVIKHFNNEEIYMRDIQYPYLKDQVALHDAFRKKINALEAKNKRNQISNKELLEINFLMKDWLIHHILVEDKKIGEFVRTEKNDGL